MSATTKTYQEGYAEQIAGITGDLVIPTRNRETPWAEVEEVIGELNDVVNATTEGDIDWVPGYRARFGDGDFDVRTNEVYIEVDRNALEAIAKEGVSAGLAHFRIIAIRLDAEGDLILHAGRIEEVDGGN